MKRFKAICFLISIPVFAQADFICFEGRNKGILLSSSGAFAETWSMDICLAAVKASKNGFACVPGYADQGVVLTTGETRGTAPSLKECQDAVDTSRNGFACVPKLDGWAVLMTTGKLNGPTLPMAECKKYLEASH